MDDAINELITTLADDRKLIVCSENEREQIFMRLKILCLQAQIAYIRDTLNKQ